MRASSILLLALLTGCTTSAPPPVAPIENAPATSTGPTPVAAPVPADPPKARHPAGEVSVDLPEGDPRARLGSPCDVGTAGCGTAGRVVVVTDTIHHGIGGSRPRVCALQALTPPMAAPDAISACVGGGLLLVERHCIVCRIDSMVRLLGSIPEMSTEQLEAAQKMAGLPASPVLATERDWKDAIAQKARSIPTSP